MEAFGYVYVPQRCEPGTGVECILHVFFHGCGMQVSVVNLSTMWKGSDIKIFQQPEEIGSEFIETAGFMEVADSNDMVVLFPSTVARALIANPYGCFNWYGYLGDLGR